MPLRPRRGQYLGQATEELEVLGAVHWQAEPAQHLVEVRSRIRTNQQNTLAKIGEGDGSGTGDRCLADAALSREEDVAVCLEQAKRCWTYNGWSVCGISPSTGGCGW